MQRLRDAKWQSAHLAANGTAHVPWEPVLSSYAELVEAADVLGRPDVAAALAARVTPQLCRAYAPALAVLRRVARDPLSQAPLEFAREAAPPTNEEVWADAMQGVRDELRPAELSSLSEDDAQEVATSPGPASDDEAGQPAPQLALAAAKVRPLVAARLSHAELVRELRLCLLGLSTLHGAGVAGISGACSASVWARFEQLARALAALAADALVAARAEVLRWRCATVIQLVAAAERLVAKYARLPPRVDTSGVNMFLSGDAQSPAVVRDGARFTWAPELRPELRHAVLLRAGEAAVLAVRIHGAPLAPAAVAFTTPQQYAADVYRIDARNSALLMTAGLKTRLAACWRALAGVYLAQDARVLLFLGELSARGELSTLSTLGSSASAELRELRERAERAQRVLDAVWPAAPFALGPRVEPVYTRELDAALEEVLGPGLARVFPPARLAAAWAQVVRAFGAGDQRVELAMAARAAAVAARVRDADALEPFI